jgi:hypothetical protein
VTYQSPRGQSAYWPRTSTTVHAYDKTGKTYLFQADTYLNRGAKESRPGNFDAKEELSFADQDTMLVQIDKVRANLEQVSKQAAQYLGTRVVEQSR